MSAEDDHAPTSEGACAQRVLSLIQDMARAMSPSERRDLARQAKSLLTAFRPATGTDDESRLSTAGQTLDACRRLLDPPANRRPV